MVSRDQGELALAMSFLHGQELTRQTRVLLPVDPDQSELPAPIPTSFYATLADIESAVDAFAPDLVLLFSAYWFRFDRVASSAELGRFLDRLRADGRRIVTSDPFLGLAPGLTLTQVDPGMMALNHPPVTRWIIRLVMRARGSRAPLIPMPDLRDVTHLYPGAAPDVGDGVDRVAFFNPAFLRDADAIPAPGAPAADGETAGHGAHWVFVVSDADVRSQGALVGPAEFTKNVVRMLQYAVEMHRQPTLVAPPGMIRQIGSVASRWGEVRSFRPFAEVERRLLEAEYAFFWDAFSVFQLPRLAAGRPVFHFDRGYHGRVIRPFYDVARACYYGGWEPKYLDPRQIFSPYVLAHLAGTQAEALAGVRERWRGSPAPDALVQRLHRQPASPASA